MATFTKNNVDGQQNRERVNDVNSPLYSINITDKISL